MATAAPVPQPMVDPPVPPMSPPTRVSVPGVLLVVPALLVTLVQLAIPSLLTFLGSFQSITVRSGGEFVGSENYGAIVRLMPGALGIAIVLSLIAAVVGVLGALIGTLSARGGAVPRRITAALAGVLLTMCAPVGMAVALHNPDLVLRAPLLALSLTSLLVWLPPVLAGGMVVGLLTGRPGETRTGPLVVAGLLGVVATGAAGSQAFVVPVLTGGGRRASSLQSLAHELAFIRFDFSQAMAVETLVLLGVGVLGILAVVILVLSRVRLELTGPTSTRGSVVGWIGLGLAGVALVVVLLVHRGWLAGLVAPAGPEMASGVATSWMINTWGPSLLLAVVQVMVAGAAGFGLGWFRPAGRGNSWLLLLFAPWLLLSATPLTVQHFHTAMQLGVVNSPLTVLPPIWVSLPAMVGFSWLFGALGEAHRAARAGQGTSTTARGIVTGAAGTILIGSLLWLTIAQSFAWSWANGRNVDDFTGPVALYNLTARQPYGGSAPPQWISTPIPVLVVLAILIATTLVLTTDRLALVTGQDGQRPVGDLPHGQTPEQAHASGPAVVAGRDRHDPIQG